MERALVLLEVCGAEAIPDHHVVTFEDFLDHGRSGIGRVCIIAVGHDIDIGIDVFEHGADDITLTLAGLLTDDGTFSCGNLGGAVCGVVVVDVDSGIWQSVAEITYDFTDGDFLVVAGEKHRSNWGVTLLIHKHYYRRGALLFVCYLSGVKIAEDTILISYCIDWCCLGCVM